MAKTPAPVPAPIDPAGIPQELQALPRWMVWRYEWNGEKWTKVPYQAERPDAHASSTNPGTWATFGKALDAYMAGDGDGIGLALTEEDDLAGFDLDHVSTWTEEARAIVQELASYTEVTPSGDGWRVFVRGRLPADTNRKRGNLETYETGRYLTVTGHHLEGTPTTVEARQEAAESVCRRYLARPKPAPLSHAAPAPVVDVADVDLLAKARGARNGAAFEALWRGEWEGRYPSQSEADAALCAMLAFWTGKDPARMDRLFRQSGLYREKWDNRHHGDGSTYGQETIRRAIETTREVYAPGKDGPEDQGRSRTEGRGAQKPEKPSPPEIGKALLETHHFVYVWERLWVYRGGCYRRDGEQVAREAVQEALGEDARKRDGDEVVYWLQNACRVDPDRVNASSLVNVQNGLLDPLTGGLHPHTPEHLSTVQLPVVWDPDAYHERFDRFFGEVLPSYQTRLLVEETIGYCLLPDNRFEKAVLTIGGGANGKTVLLYALRKMLGDENVASVRLQDLQESRFAVAELAGKVANIYPDLPRDALTETDTFKNLVTGETIKAERKFRNPFDFTNRAKLFFSANELPRAADRTEGFYRRWLLIPFFRSFEGDPNRDPELKFKLSSPEALSYLLRLAVEGLRRLLKRGEFTETDETKEALEQYRRENDSVLAFVEDACKVSPDGEEPKKALYAAYRNWCAASGLRPVNNVHFMRGLRGRVPSLEETKLWSGGSRVRLLVGITLLDRDLLDGGAPPPGDEDAPPLRGLDGLGGDAA